MNKSLIQTDRFGARHFYYAFDGKKSATGTSFKEVADAASSKKLDWLGIGGFLRFGFFPDNRTYYEDVKILKPATEYTFDEHGKMTGSRRYWDWNYRPDFKRSYQDTIDEFAHIFHQVIKEQTSHGRIAVPISGGLDSRSTVAALQNIQADRDRLWAYSYGYSDRSAETTIAGEVARSAGLSFNSYTVKPYLFQKINSILDALEGFQDITQARQAFVSEEIRANADSLICAHWGDVWLDSMLKEKHGTDLAEVIFEKFCKKGSDKLTALFKEHLSENLDSCLKEMIREKLKSLEKINNEDFKVKAFKTDWWSFRWTLASIRIFETAARPLLPFYDDRLADFFMTVPVEYVAGRKLQIDYLKKYAPELAKIEWQGHDANLYDYQNFVRRAPARIRRKIRKFFSEKKTPQRNWEAQFLNVEGRDGLKTWLKNPGLRIHEFISKTALFDEVENFLKTPDAGRGYEISMLVTLSAALERLK